MPPCKSEALRVELTRKQEAAASFATQRLSMCAHGMIWCLHDVLGHILSTSVHVFSCGSWSS